MTDPVYARLFARLVTAVEQHIEPLFKSGTNITVLVTTPGNPEADVLISSETMEGIQEALERSKTRTNIAER